jgi:hypothetical protein
MLRVPSNQRRMKSQHRPIITAHHSIMRNGNLVVCS